MSAYLTADELADMIDCQPYSFACMRRWLDKNGWPYQVSIRGFPKVSREYHKARTAGLPAAAVEATDELEPDFSMFGVA